MSLLNDASLVMIPSGYKDTKLYSVKPTNGDGDFTFSRGSNLAATRVNSEGLIEKGRENLLLQSNQFDTTWGNGDITATSGQSGYDGSNDAWRIVPNTTNASHYLEQSLTFAGVYTMSVYAKADGYDYIFLWNSALAKGQFFNIATGSVASPYLGGGIDANITSVGGGWYRCEFTFQASGVGNNTFFACQADNAFIFAGNGTDGILIQDAQLEQGLVATDYIETGASTAQAGILEDMPRLDYTGGATCPSLLLEPQRSNLNPSSEYFGSWLNSGSTITANYGISPDGTQNAYRYQKTAGSRGVVYRSIGVSNGATYTISMYAKSLSGTQKIRIGADNTCAIPQGAETFEITTEWKRISTTITSTETNWNIFFDNVESGTACTGTYLEADLLVYGFQVEAGSYPTSYIPTYGASVTRSADDATQTLPDSILGTDYNEGTLFVEATINQEAITRFASIVGTFWTTSSVRLEGTPSTGEFFADIVTGGTGATSNKVTLSPLSIGDTVKMAVAWDSGSLVVSANGQSSVGSYTTMTTKINALYLNRLGTFSGVGTFESNDFKQVLIFPNALTETELNNLTTI